MKQSGRSRNAADFMFDLQQRFYAYCRCVMCLTQRSYVASVGCGLTLRGTSKVYLLNTPENEREPMEYPKASGISADCSRIRTPQTVITSVYEGRDSCSYSWSMLNVATSAKGV